MSRIIHIILVAFLVSIFGCEHSSKSVSRSLDKVEYLMENRPDSALSILNSIDVSSISTKKQNARYALLKSMALDKNFIDTTNFDILQPAIDYYLLKGTPDEKLRTYYYQGRIYQNKNDKDSALRSFMKGLDIAPTCKDSLTIARTLVAQGGLYHAFYDFTGYSDNYLKAANIYNGKVYKEQVFDCLLHALDGNIVLKRKEKADSLIKMLDNFYSLDDLQKHRLQSYKLSYILRFGSNQNLRNFIETNKDSLYYDANGIMNLALAYHRLENQEAAIEKLEYLDSHSAPYDTLKYSYIKYLILQYFVKI